MDVLIAKIIIFLFLVMIFSMAFKDLPKSFGLTGGIKILLVLLIAFFASFISTSVLFWIYYYLFQGWIIIVVIIILAFVTLAIWYTYSWRF